MFSSQKSVVLDCSSEGQDYFCFRVRKTVQFTLNHSRGPRVTASNKRAPLNIGESKENLKQVTTEA